MKIILCIFLLNITAVSVFGQSVPLDGTLGRSVKFPAAVKKGGSLMYSGVPIGEVDSGSFTLPRDGKYRGRLDWDSSTGLFSLSGLTKEDSGEYKVHNTDQNIIAVFQLNVYTVSVFGKELNGTLGQSIKFPATVKKGGSLIHSDVTIGDVTSGSFWTSRDVNYRDRVQWDSSTGLFSLSGLKMEDIGEYEVRNTDQNINTVFQLNVYIPVSKPHVSITQNEYSCTIECTAERGTGVTLSWYREGQKSSYVSSRVESAPHLHLPETVERSGTYTCEARNSVSRETSDPLTVGAHCTAPAVTDSSSTWIIAAIIITAVAVLIAVVFAVQYYRIRRRQAFIRRCLAVRTLIQVKKLLDNVDLHAYDETVPPYAVRPFIQVKKLLDNVRLHAYDETVHPNAVRAFIQVKMILDNVDPHECDETVPRDAVRTLIQVTNLLNDFDLHTSAQFLFDLENSEASGFRRGIPGFLRRCLCPEATENMTSSHQTEVPLNQATREVGEP